MCKKDNNEITIIVPIKAKTEFRMKVRKTLLELAASTNLETGNICYCLHQDKTDHNHFVIYEKWENQEALDFHMNQDYLKAFLNESKTLLSEEIKGTICQQIS